MHTPILQWLLVGLVAGFIAGKLINKTGQGAILDIVLGLVGAVVGGYLSTRILHGPPISGPNLTGLVIAAAGSLVVLFAYHQFVRRRPQSVGDFLRRQLRR